MKKFFQIIGERYSFTVLVMIYLLTVVIAAGIFIAFFVGPDYGTPISVVFPLLGFFLLTFSFSLIIVKIRYMNYLEKVLDYGKKTMGKVTEVKPSSKQPKSAKEPVLFNVTFEFKDGFGNVFKGRARMVHAVKEQFFAVGDNIPVSYMPKHPRENLWVKVV